MHHEHMITLALPANRIVHVSNAMAINYRLLLLWRVVSCCVVTVLCLMDIATQTHFDSAVDFNLAIEGLLGGLVHSGALVLTPIESSCP